MLLNRRLLYILVALLTLTTAPLRAQGPVRSASSGIISNGDSDGDERAAAHSITGAVLDPSGAAIAQAQITLLGSGSEAVATATSDAVGAFHFDDIAPGKYTLNFHAEGFRDARIAAVVNAKRFTPLHVVLPILVATENVTVATGVNVPTVSTETSENQNNNAIDRDALDRIPVFDQDYHHDHVAILGRQRDRNERGHAGGERDRSQRAGRDAFGGAGSEDQQ